MNTAVISAPCIVACLATCACTGDTGKWRNRQEVLIKGLVFREQVNLNPFDINPNEPIALCLAEYDQAQDESRDPPREVLDAFSDLPNVMSYSQCAPEERGNVFVVRSSEGQPSRRAFILRIMRIEWKEETAVVTAEYNGGLDDYMEHTYATTRVRGAWSVEKTVLQKYATLQTGPTVTPRTRDVRDLTERVSDQA